jgi:hypothetical protein
MKSTIWVLPAAITVFMAVSGCGTPPPAQDQAADTGSLREGDDELGAARQNRSGNFYTAAEYDPAADPAQDLADTVAQASLTGKRILLEIGGQW